MKNIVCLIFMVFSVLACSAAPQISKLNLEDFDFFDTSDMPLAEKYFFQTDIILPKSKNKYDRARHHLYALFKHKKFFSLFKREKSRYTDSLQRKFRKD